MAIKKHRCSIADCKTKVHPKLRRCYEHLSNQRTSRGECMFRGCDEVRATASFCATHQADIVAMHERSAMSYLGSSWRESYDLLVKHIDTGVPDATPTGGRCTERGCKTPVLPSLVRCLGHNEDGHYCLVKGCDGPSGVGGVCEAHLKVVKAAHLSAKKPFQSCSWFDSLALLSRALNRCQHKGCRKPKQEGKDELYCEQHRGYGEAAEPRIALCANKSCISRRFPGARTCEEHLTHGATSFACNIATCNVPTPNQSQIICDDCARRVDRLNMWSAPWQQTIAALTKAMIPEAPPVLDAGPPAVKTHKCEIRGCRTKTATLFRRCLSHVDDFNPKAPEACLIADCATDTGDEILCALHLSTATEALARHGKDFEDTAWSETLDALQEVMPRPSPPPATTVIIDTVNSATHNGEPVLIHTNIRPKNPKTPKKTKKGAETTRPADTTAATAITGTKDLTEDDVTYAVQTLRDREKLGATVADNNCKQKCSQPGCRGKRTQTATVCSEHLTSSPSNALCIVARCGNSRGRGRILFCKRCWEATEKGGRDECNTSRQDHMGLLVDFADMMLRSAEDKGKPRLNFASAIKAHNREDLSNTPKPRHVFYVDVGDLPPAEAVEAIKRLKERLLASGRVPGPDDSFEPLRLTSVPPETPVPAVAAESLLSAVEADAKTAAARLAATQLIKLTREPVVAYLQRTLGVTDASTLVSFLKSGLGESVLRGALSLALGLLPGIAGQAQAALARELRVSSMTAVMDVVADLLLAPLRQVLCDLLAGTPEALPSPLKAQVCLHHHTQTTEVQETVEVGHD